MAAGKSGFSLLNKWVILALVLILAGGAWYYTQGEEKASYSFDSEAIDKGLIEQSVSATGSVQALITVDLSSQLSGQVSQVKADFNSKVKKGDLLAVIDKKTFETKVKSAEANLEMALAGVEVQKASIMKSKALAEKAKVDLERQQKLSEKGVAAQSALEGTKTALATAEADMAIAKAQLENANALVSQRKSEVQSAKIDLERTEIRSPIDGVVISRTVDQGATVAASLSAPILFKIAQDLSKIQIETLVDEADIGRIKKGNEVTFTVDAYPDATFRGRVEQVRIGGSTENNVVTYTVIVIANNQKENLLPGMTATVRIVTGRKEDVLRVSNSAIRFRPAKSIPGAEKRPRWGRNEAFLEELAELLKLSDDQQVQLKKALEELRARRVNVRSTAQNNGNGAKRENRRKRSEGSSKSSSQSGGRLFRILSKILTEEQAEVFKKWRAERRESSRPAVVWVKGKDGVVPRRIRVGLSDEAYSEIVAGALKEGDKVITRVRSERKNARRRRR